MEPDEMNRVRTYLYEAVEKQLRANGTAFDALQDSDRFADLGIDSMGILRLYLVLQEYPGADLDRIADENAPERIGDLIALGSKALDLAHV